MKEIRFQGNGDELKFRVDSLPPLVRAYFAHESALQSQVITDDTKQILKDEMIGLVKVMKPKEQAQLLMHKKWLKEVKKNGT